MSDALNSNEQTVKESIVESPLTELDFQQYEHLRKEIDADIAEVRLLERSALFATGAVWAWLATQNATINATSASFVASHPQAWLIPCLFAILGGVRCVSILQYVALRTNYIKKMEHISNVSRSTMLMLGWETYLERAQKARISIGISLTSYFFWFLLLSLTVLVARFQNWAGTYSALYFWSLFGCASVLLAVVFRWWMVRFLRIIRQIV